MLLTLLEIVDSFAAQRVGVGHDSNFIIIAEHRQPSVLQIPAQLELPALPFPGEEVPRPGVRQVLLKL